MLFKLETRLRRLVWRASNPTYGVFMTSCVLSLLAMKALATSYGPADTHRRRVAAESTYAKRRFYEVNDNPVRAADRPLGPLHELLTRHTRSLRLAPTLAPAHALLATFRHPTSPPNAPRLHPCAPHRPPPPPRPTDPLGSSTASRRTPSAATASIQCRRSSTEVLLSPTTDRSGRGRGSFLMCDGEDLILRVHGSQTIAHEATSSCPPLVK